MPLYDYQCLDGHLHEHYYPLADQAPLAKACYACGETALRQMSQFVSLNFFSESNGQIINNLAPGVPIHSHQQHRALMKANGLEPATDWHVSKRPSRM